MNRRFAAERILIAIGVKRTLACRRGRLDLKRLTRCEHKWGEFAAMRPIRSGWRAGSKCNAEVAEVKNLVHKIQGADT
jgi:hypothetical protein